MQWWERPAAGKIAVMKPKTITRWPGVPEAFVSTFGDVFTAVLSGWDRLRLCGTLRPLSRQNDALMASLRLGATEEISFKSKDGTEIHGFVVKPPDFQDGRKVPAILRIHGGPVGQFQNEFMTDWQMFAARGYAVVAANPRGSSGRGEAFARAIYAELHRCDEAGAELIVVEALPDAPQWRAIADRLQRAAA